MSKRVLVWVLGGICAGCASGPRAPVGAPVVPAGTPVAPKEERLELAMQAVVGEVPRQRPIGPGEVLHNQDMMRLSLMVTKAAYVYVALVPASGSIEAIYPPGADAQIGARQPLALPDGERGFELSGEPGREEIWAVASARPLCEMDRALGAQVGQVCPTEGGVGGTGATREAKQPPPPPPTETIKPGTRGDLFAAPPEQRVQRAPADERGMAVLRFSYQHE